MNVFELIATLNLNTTGYTSGLSSAKSALSGFSIFTNRAFAKIDAFAVNTLKTAARAVTGFIKSSIDAGTEFDSSMSQVAATLGKTMDDMLTETGKVDLAWGEFSGNLREYALEMGRNTKFTATEVADALNYMALAGYNTQQSMEMLPNVLNLASAGAMDLAKASDMVTDTQKAFGLTFERTNLLVDEMAKAASTGNTSVEQLGDAFLKISSLAKELNGGFVTLADGTEASVDGFEELTIMFTALADKGSKGTEAATHLRNGILKLIKPTDEAEMALNKLNVKIFDDEGAMRSWRAILKDMSLTMDDNVVPAFEKFYNQVSLIGEKQRKKEFKTKEHAEEYRFFGVSVVDAAGNLRDFNDVLAEVQTTFKEGGLTQGQKLEAIATIFNTRDVGALKGLLESVDEDWDRIGESILGASEVGVLYQGKLYGIEAAQKKFGDAIYDTEKGFKVLGAAEFMAMEQNNNLKGDLTFFDSALSGVKIAISDALNPALRTLVQTGTEGLSGLAEKLDNANFREKLENIGEKLGKLADKAVDFLINLDWDRILDGIADGIDKGAEALKYLFDNSDKVISVVKILLGVLAAWKVAQVILNITMLANPISLVIIAIGLLIAAGILLYQHWDEVKDKAKELWQAVKDAWEALGEDINRVCEEIKDYWKHLKLAIGLRLFEIKNLIRETWENIKESTMQKWEEIKSKVQEIIDDIKSIFEDPVDKAKQWGSDLIGNFKKGIESMLGGSNGLTGALSKTASKVKSYLHFSKPDEGPLVDFDTYAPDMMKLFARGIAEGEHYVTDQIDKSFDFGMRTIDSATNISRGTTQGDNISGKEIVLSIDGHELARFLAPAMNSQLAFTR